ncbi:MAG TPA: ABC transporter permease, partial [Rubrivivax sp.]|nr:ABC transporter permease [Rubrivivax sp.]
ESLLDLALARQHAMRESSYSAPLAWQALSKDTIVQDGRVSRRHLRLEHGGAHLADPPSQWHGDLGVRALA